MADMVNSLLKRQSEREGLLVTRWWAVSSAYQSLQTIMVSHRQIEQLISLTVETHQSTKNQPPSYKEEMANWSGLLRVPILSGVYQATGMIK